MLNVLLRLKKKVSTWYYFSSSFFFHFHSNIKQTCSRWEGGGRVQLRPDHGVGEPELPVGGYGWPGGDHGGGRGETTRLRHTEQVLTVLQGQAGGTG